MVLYAAKQLKMDSVSGADVLIWLGIIYLVAGALAALAGWRLSPVKPHESGSARGWEQSPERINTLFGLSERQSYSVFLLIGHILVLTLLLLGMNKLKFYFWILPVAVYLLFCLIRYKRALYQLLRPKFWIQMVLITFLSTVLLESVATHHWFDRSGFEAGILMNLRAFMVLTAFTAISTEMKNPLVKALVFRKGFSSLYKSVSLAFSVLPGILNLTARDGNKKLAFRSIIGGYLIQADLIFEQFKNLEASLPPVTIIIGDREEGKTSFLRKYVNDLISDGKRVSGFLAVGIHGPDGQRIGFNIKNVETGEEIGFCMNDGEPGWEKIGRFRINPDGLAKGYEWMSAENIQNSDILVVDELGPLEMAGKGWSDLIGHILHENPKPMIWTVRRNLAEKIAVKWNIGRVSFVDIADGGNARSV
jgi:nucleoside-triphosphatase THEP1